MKILASKQAFSLFLLLGLSGLLAKKSKAEIFPAAVGDSLRLEFQCLDSLGNKRACDSVWFAVHRFPTSGSRVLVDSGRATTFTETALGTSAKATLLPGRDSTYMISEVGNATAGLYKMHVLCWGGVANGKPLTTPYTRWFIVGAAVTSTFLAASDPQTGTIVPGDAPELLETGDTAKIRGDIEAGTAALANQDPENLIHDPGFEATASGTPSATAGVWHDSVGTSIVTNATIKMGRKVARLKPLTDGTNAKMLSDTLRLAQGNRILYGADVWGSSTGGGIPKIGIQTAGGSSITTISPTYALGWEKLSNYFKITATGDYFFYALIQDPVAGIIDSMRLDNAFVKIVADSVTPYANLADVNVNSADSVKAMGTSGTVFAGDREVRVNSIDTLTQILNEVRVNSIDTLTTLLGNVNGNVAGNVTGSVGSVLAEVRVNSIDTLRMVTAVDTARYLAKLDTLSTTTDFKQAFGRWISAGTAAAVTSSSITLGDGPAVDTIRGASVFILSATTGAGQTRFILNYNTGTRLATIFPTWSVTPTGTIKYIVYSGYGGLDAAALNPDASNEIADSVDNHAMFLNQGQRDSIARAAADSVWKSLFASRNGVANSFGQAATTNLNTLGWAQTGASATDTSNIKTMMLNNRFARHRSAPGSNLDTVNAVASLQSLGSGPYTATVYFLDSATNAAVQGWNVSYRDSITGTNYTQVMQSDANGKVQANVIGSTTYFVRGSRNSSRFATNADTTLNVAAANFIDTVTVVSLAPTAPTIAGLTRVYGNLKDIGQDSNIVGVEVYVTTVKSNLRCCDADTVNFWIAGKFTKQATFTCSSCWQIDLVPSVSWNPDTDYKFTIKVPGVGEFTKVVTVPSSPVVWRLQWTW